MLDNFRSWVDIQHAYQETRPISQIRHIYSYDRDRAWIVLILVTAPYVCIPLILAIRGTPLLYGLVTIAFLAWPLSLAIEIRLEENTESYTEVTA